MFSCSGSWQDLLHGESLDKYVVQSLQLILAFVSMINYCVFRFVSKEQIKKKEVKPLQTLKQKLKENNVEKKKENTKTRNQEKNTEKLTNQKNYLQILEVNEETDDGPIENERNLILNENPKPLTNKRSDLEKLEEEAATDLFR